MADQFIQLGTAAFSATLDLVSTTVTVTAGHNLTGATSAAPILVRADTATSLNTAPFAGTASPEFLRITGNPSSTTLTVLRAQDGSTAKTAAVTDVLTHVIGASSLSGISLSATPAGAVLAGGLGVIGKGYRIPAGSLDVWRAARNASATTRCEVVGFGDSLTFGTGPTVGQYSFLQRLRERAGTDGYVDGGRGFNSSGSLTPVDNFAGETTPVSAQTGFNLGLPGGITPMPSVAVSTTLNDTISYTVFGTACRLWWTRYFQAGRFSYKVNAQAVVVVNASYNESPPLPTVVAGLSSIDSILLGAADGLVAGTNTIVVTNLGGAPIGPPGSWNGISAGGTGGTIPAGSYEAVATGTNGTGETAQTTTTVVATVTAGQNLTLTLDARNLNPLGITNIKYYARTPSGSGLYSLIGTTAIGASNAFTTYVWTGTPAINTSAHPPAAPGTAGLDGSNKLVAVNVEWLKATGIVWHNQGVTGTMASDFFDPNGLNDSPLASLGLQWGTGTNGFPIGAATEQLPTAAQSTFDTPINRTQARKPSLVILAFGTNEIQKGEGGFAALAAPTAATAGVGVGSGLAAATYFYKVQRLVTGAGGPLSPASTGVTATVGQQIAVTSPILGAGGATGGAMFNVFRSTTVGGTYGLVGQIDGVSQTLLDSVATPGGQPASTTVFTPLVDTTTAENSLSLALRLIRNSGADALVVIPSIESMNNSRTLGGSFKVAIQRVADTFGAAWVDFDVVLGATALRAGLGFGGGSSNPHLLKPAYQAEGDFIWDKVLKL